jgi:hypothetical protein
MWLEHFQHVGEKTFAFRLDIKPVAVAGCNATYAPDLRRPITMRTRTPWWYYCHPVTIHLSPLKILLPRWAGCLLYANLNSICQDTNSVKRNSKFTGYLPVGISDKIILYTVF